MSILSRLEKLEKAQPKQIKHKPMPLSCFYGENIPESEWPEYDTIPTLADFYRSQNNEH